MIATDGVFSMDGYIANLPGICELADKYDALVMVDDSHAVGFMGKRGRGTHEYHGVMDRVDIITGTLGKALGGASGGYTSGRRELIEMLRQRSRPYLFSNSRGTADRVRVDQGDRTAEWNRRSCATSWSRIRSSSAQEITKVGYDVLPGEHPIVPIMLYDAALASRTADALAGKGHLRDRVLVPGGPAGQGAHPHADFRRPFARGPGLGRREICRSAPRTGVTG